MCILFSMCLFACHLCISISLSHSLYVYVCISLYLNSVYRHTYGLHPVPAYLGICLHVSLPVCPYVYLYVWQSICPSASISSSLYYCAPCPLVPLSLCLLLSGPQTAEYFVIMSGERLPPPRFKSVLPECKRDSSLPFQTLLLPSAVCIYAVELSERLSVWAGNDTRDAADRTQASEGSSASPACKPIAVFTASISRSVRACHISSLQWFLQYTRIWTWLTASPNLTLIFCVIRI